MIVLRTPIFVVVQNWMFWPENDRYKNEFLWKYMISGDVGIEPSCPTIQATSPFVERNFFVRILLHSSKIWTKSYSSTIVYNEQNLISTTRCLILSMRHVLFDKFVSDWAIAPVNSLRCALGEWQRFLLWEFFDLPNQISILSFRWWIWMHESNDWILKTKEFHQAEQLFPQISETPCSSNHQQRRWYTKLTQQFHWEHFHSHQ